LLATAEPRRPTSSAASPSSVVVVLSTASTEGPPLLRSGWGRAIGSRWTDADLAGKRRQQFYILNDDSDLPKRTQRSFYDKKKRELNGIFSQQHKRYCMEYSA